MRWSMNQPGWVRAVVRHVVGLFDQCARTRSPLWEFASSTFLVYTGWRALTSLYDGTLASVHPVVFERLSQFWSLDWLAGILLGIGAMQLFVLIANDNGMRKWLSFAALCAWATLAALFLIYSGTDSGLWIGALFTLTSICSFFCAFSHVARRNDGRDH